MTSPTKGPLHVLVACEYSGVVRRAFRELGHEAWSCDLLPSEDGSVYHIQGDCVPLLHSMPWDLLIAHPPCTYLCSSGIHWNRRVPGRAEKTAEAAQFVRTLLSSGIPHICVENPIGVLSSLLRKPDQIIQPWMFGHDASKATCLWLKDLPKLVPTAVVPGRMVNGRPRWGNQTDSGQNRLGPSPDRWKERSRTYEGIAAAMAEQYSNWIGDTRGRATNPERNTPEQAGVVNAEQVPGP